MLLNAYLKQKIKKERRKKKKKEKEKNQQFKITKAIKEFTYMGKYVITLHG